jgi:CheY-like chemotaxis protein
MLRNDPTSFVTQTGNDLASIRSSLLVAAQTGDNTGLRYAKTRLSRIANVGSLGGHLHIAAMAGECIEAIEQLVGSKDADLISANAALDSLARIEAAILDLSLLSDDSEANDLSVDDAFEMLIPAQEESEAPAEIDEFAVDEETLEIFRAEADGLLANISLSLNALAASPDDKHSLWEIRRNAHTLKGSAGIVGLDQIATLAHRAEDLLDHLVEKGSPANERVIEFLTKTVEYIGNSLVGATGGRSDADIVELLSSDAPADAASENAPATQGATQSAAVLQMPPVVRVSLERIDEILELSTKLIEFQRSANKLIEDNARASREEDLRNAILTHAEMAAEVHRRLLRIRMVRFGNLETRLTRNVNVTCGDEGKKAVLQLSDPDVEIDTLIIDALIEPMLHLIKNAVVHGIEPPETRRLIGKPEAGTITVKAGADDDAVIVSISDDGGGLSTSRIVEKALETGILTEEKAAAMSEKDIHQLIFSRGLTTAEKIDLNAGRGVGMSIVKESIEAKGGSIHVETVPQQGTTFTLIMPANVTAADRPRTAVDEAPDDDSPLILVVDDSAAIRHQTAKFAAAAGCRTITANDGAEALELLLSGAHEPDLILSDVEMPNMNGWELLEYIKTDDNLGHIPVVMITSLDDAEYRQKAKELGAAEYIVKPPTVDKIAGCIERALAVV